VFMNRMQQAWQGKKVAGALLMDVKSAFNNVSRPILSRRLGELGIEPDLVRWTDSFMSDRKVRLVLEGREGGGMRWKRGSHRDPQWRRYCSRATCLGVRLRGRRMPRQGLSFVDNVAWWAEGKSEK